MYEKVGTVDTKVHKFLKDCAKAATWKVVKGSGRDYLTSFPDDLVKELFDWDNWQSAFFLKIPPGGMVHRHTDVDDPWSTYHVVVQTNPEAISYFIMNGEQHGFTTDVRGIYKVNRKLEHWAVNNGRSGRIHLLCEVYE